MDPISVAASIVGLLGAAAKISSILSAVVKSVKAAPGLAQSVLSEVTDVSICLYQLQKYLLGIKEVPKSRENCILVEQIVVILSNSVLIFSELEEKLEGVDFDHPSQPLKIVNWVLKEQSLSTLLARLQSSKMSLNLILTTLTW